MKIFKSDKDKVFVVRVQGSYFKELQNKVDKILNVFWMKILFHTFCQ